MKKNNFIRTNKVLRKMAYKTCESQIMLKKSYKGIHKTWVVKMFR